MTDTRKHIGVTTARMRLDDLQPAGYNPREISKEAIQALESSVARFGLVQPIIFNKRTGHIVGGHQRLSVLRAQGAESTDVVVVDMEELEEEACNIALNSSQLAGHFTDGLGDLLARQREENEELFAALRMDVLDLKFRPPVSEAPSLDTEVDLGVGDAGEAPPALTHTGDVVDLGRHRLHCGDCLEVMRSLPAGSVQSIVTDPPYGLSIGTTKWDEDVPQLEFATEALRIVPPGGHLIAFSATKTVHRLMAALEAAGWEIRDMGVWLYYSGDPKGLDISKAIDKTLGQRREAVTTKTMRKKGAKSVRNDKRGKDIAVGNTEVDITIPTSAEARMWDGWGTALVPSIEPWVLARKPPEGTVAENVLKHGVGGLNIEGCRIAPDDDAWPNTTTNSRWPPNTYYCAKPTKAERGPGNTHPTVKPIKLMRWLVRLVTPAGGTVFEPYAGSGTTVLAGEMEGVKVIASEMSPEFCDIIRARFGALQARGE